MKLINLFALSILVKKGLVTTCADKIAVYKLTDSGISFYNDICLKLKSL